MYLVLFSLTLAETFCCFSSLESTVYWGIKTYAEKVIYVFKIVNIGADYMQNMDIVQENTWNN